MAEFLDAVVSAVGDVDVSRYVYHDPGRLIELAVARTWTSPDRKERPRFGEFLHTVVAYIGYVNRAVRSD